MWVQTLALVLTSLRLWVRELSFLTLSFLVCELEGIKTNERIESFRREIQAIMWKQIEIFQTEKYDE